MWHPFTAGWMKFRVSLLGLNKKMRKKKDKVLLEISFLSLLRGCEWKADRDARSANSEDLFHVSCKLQFWWGPYRCRECSSHVKSTSLIGHLLRHQRPSVISSPLSMGLFIFILSCFFYQKKKKYQLHVSPLRSARFSKQYASRLLCPTRPSIHYK